MYNKALLFTRISLEPLKFLLIICFALTFLSPATLYAGVLTSNISESETDTGENRLYTFFDLRERETYLQLTNIEEISALVHIQIFNVNDNCNENNFFDTYTGNDTHIYNLRDIITNNGNPSGVVLPESAYGIVAISLVDPEDGGFEFIDQLIGNTRIIDESGYEYRTNTAGRGGLNQDSTENALLQYPNYTFNFNKEEGVIFSDIVGLTINDDDDDCNPDVAEVCVADPTRAFIAFDVDILNNNEDIFSCRNVIFACIDEQNPRQDELLELVGVANIARFEYGINNAIPHSKGGELLCPGNIIDEGLVTLQTVRQPTNFNNNATFLYFVGFVGLNNGNERGSMDMFWNFNLRSIPRS